jgi:hypothetical protein
VRTAVAVVVSTLVATGCGASAPMAFQRSDAAAERAYSAGRYAEAAEHWLAAAANTDRSADRDEARYRAAKSYEKAGRRDEAAALLSRLAHDSPRGERAARAAYDVALLHLATDEARGAAELDAMIRAHAESGVAVEALHRRLDAIATRGEPAVRAYLGALLPALENGELGQYLHYAYAQSLERSDEPGPARDRYVLVATRYPFPAALWDDALFHAAELDVQLGEPARAIEGLELILTKREAAYIQGSYERRRYADAQFRIAELYRDVLGDPQRARAAFEQLWSAHRSSRLRDDAAWNAARLAAQGGDADGACSDLRALVSEIPTSRYAPCVAMLCPAMRPAPGAGACHDYVAREAAPEGRSEDR